ncbi:MAG: oligosaccharide flippase family protein [Phycisphaera sp.]|nr:oligosaccharide flippase family protein [Phycisphaera sp.]
MSLTDLWQSVMRRLGRSKDTQKLASGAGLALVVIACGALMRYGLNVSLARWMGGPEPLGRYAVALAWMQVLAVLASLGMNIGCLRFVPEYIERKDWPHLRGLIGFSRITTLIVGTLIAMLATLGVWIVGREWSHEWPVVLGFWAVPLMALADMHSQHLRGYHRILRAFVPFFMLQPILILAISAGIYLVTGQLHPADAVIATAIALLIVIAIGFFDVHRVSSTQLREVRPAFDYTKWIKVSLPLLVVTGFNLVIIQTGVVFVDLLSDARQTGLYHATDRTAMVLNLLPRAVLAICAPMVSKAHTREDHDQLQRLATHAANLLFWPTLAFGIVFILIGKPVLGVFGPQFVAGYPVFVALLIGHLVARFAGGSAGMVLGMTGHENTSALAVCCAAVVYLALNFILIPRYGAIGAAVSTGVSMSISNGTMSVLAYRRKGVLTLAIPWRMR